jgi:hypothetical protein
VNTNNLIYTKYKELEYAGHIVFNILVKVAPDSDIGSVAVFNVSTYLDENVYNPHLSQSIEIEVKNMSESIGLISQTVS